VLQSRQYACNKKRTMNRSEERQDSTKQDNAIKYTEKLPPQRK